MNGNPGWLKPLRRLLKVADASALFPRLNRGEGAAETPAHQVLMSSLLYALRGSTSLEQPLAILADDRWAEVRSSAPMQSWLAALNGGGIPIPEVADDGPRSSTIVAMFRIAAYRDCLTLRQLSIWLAPSLWTVGDKPCLDNEMFVPPEPLNRDHVSFSYGMDDVSNPTTTVGSHRLLWQQAVVRVEDVTGSHVGTVNASRWRLLANTHDAPYLIRALPGWISQVESEERSRGVPSQQLWTGVCRAFKGDVISGCNPLVAPACFRAAVCGRGGRAWGHRGQQETRQVHNLLCLSPTEILTAVPRLSPSSEWLAVTRKKALTAAAAEHLARIGTVV